MRLRSLKLENFFRLTATPALMDLRRASTMSGSVSSVIQISGTSAIILELTCSWLVTVSRAHFQNFPLERIDSLHSLNAMIDVIIQNFWENILTKES